MRRGRPLNVCIAVVIICVFRTASAGWDWTTQPYGGWAWTSNAASCVPDKSSIANNAYHITGGFGTGYVQTTGTYPVVLTCSIGTLFSNEEEPFQSEDNAHLCLYATTKGLVDHTGQGTVSYVKVELVALSKTTMTETILTNFIATSSSTIVVTLSDFQVDWNENSYIYYVRLTLQAYGSDSQTAYGVQMVECNI
jgi:hypothetical protein